MNRRLIDHFVNAKLISRQDMQRVILRASKEKKSIVMQLLDTGMVPEDVLAQHVAHYYQVETLSGKDFHVDARALKLMSPKVAKRVGVLPYAFTPARDNILVALFDPESASEVLELLHTSTGTPTMIKIAPRSWVYEAIDHYYGGGGDSSGSDDIARQKAKAAMALNPDLRNSDSEHSGPKKQIFNSALDDLDDFLSADNSGSGELRSSQSDPNSITSFNVAHKSRTNPQFGNESPIELGGSDSNEFWDDVNASPWSWDDFDSRPKSKRVKKGGFDLFENSEAADMDNFTLQETVNRYGENINQLKDELIRQREVIQVMASLLVEARVLSRSELKRRLKSMRR